MIRSELLRHLASAADWGATLLSDPLLIMDIPGARSTPAADQYRQSVRRYNTLYTGRREREPRHLSLTRYDRAEIG